MFKYYQWVLLQTKDIRSGNIKVERSMNQSFWVGQAPAAAAAAKSLQSCPTLCNPIDGSPPGSPVPGILQARTLEWVAISFSNEWKWKMKLKLLSHVWLLVTPWTAAYQAPPSMGFSRQEYWSGVRSCSLCNITSKMFYNEDKEFLWPRGSNKIIFTSYFKQLKK